MSPGIVWNLDVKKRCVSVLVPVLPCCIAVTVYAAGRAEREKPEIQDQDESDLLVVRARQNDSKYCMQSLCCLDSS